MYRTASSDHRAAPRPFVVSANPRASYRRGRSRSGERGFTLAGVIVMMTIIAVVVAYSIPEMWSSIMRRERDLQTIWVMKQYTRAIYEFQRKRGALPVSLQQLEEQNQPRVLRQLYPNPLTGEVDWVLVPPATTPAPGAPRPPGQAQPPPPPGAASQVGPFVGVRPGISGKSFVPLNGAESYEEWAYTLDDLMKEINPQGGQPGLPPSGINPNPQQPRPPRPRPPR
ncbi:MAG TPA: type II secretion system protein [Thermoanaerobaculia bacterium]|nr:type II secretion system protein [Thermoanaerobaculia bacterium]